MSARNELPGWQPFAFGGLLVALFATLGGWQVSRGLEKRAQFELFTDESGYTRYEPGMDPRPFQRLRASGRPDSERQFLLDNIVVDGRQGHYVITPLALADDDAILLVNRGWIEKAGDSVDAGRIALDSERITVRGRAGSLPRAGFSMGDAVLAGQDWPRHAVYPDFGDIEAELGRSVERVVLLLDPGEEQGFLRRWVPDQIGPGRHFGYAFQWFAMAFVLAALLTWHYRRRKTARD